MSWCTLTSSGPHQKNSFREGWCTIDVVTWYMSDKDATFVLLIDGSSHGRTNAEQLISALSLVHFCAFQNNGFFPFYFENQLVEDEGVNS